jgi:alkylated DNA nucleotide flippase Atl1
MNWSDLVDVLTTKVPAGSVTTYAEVSTWAYGKPNRNQPVRSLLRGAANHGHLILTNRVVAVSGNLADLPEGREQQQVQLKMEGVPFTTFGAVDFSRVSAIDLGNYEMHQL